MSDYSDRPHKKDRSNDPTLIVTTTARAVYNDLIARCKAHVKAKTSVVFDPSTGIQKTFVDGKITEVKEVRVGRSEGDK